MSTEIDYATTNLAELLRAHEELLQGADDLAAGLAQGTLSPAEILIHLDEFRAAVVEITRAMRAVAARFDELRGASSS